MSYLKCLIGLLNHGMLYSILSARLPPLPEGQLFYPLDVVIQLADDAHSNCPIPRCTWRVDRSQFATANAVGGITQMRFSKTYAVNSNPIIKSTLVQDRLSQEYVLDLEDEFVHLLFWGEGMLKRKRVESGANPAKRQTVLQLMLLDRKHQNSSDDQMYFVGPGDVPLTNTIPATIRMALESRGALVPDCTNFIRAVVCDHRLRKFAVFTAPPQATADLIFTASIFALLHDFHDPQSIYARSLGKMPADRLLTDTQRCANYVLYLRPLPLSRCTKRAELSANFRNIIAHNVQEFMTQYRDYLDFSTVNIAEKNPVALIKQIQDVIDTSNAQDATEHPRSLVVIVIQYDDPFETAQQRSVLSPIPHPSIDDIRDIFSPLFHSLLSSKSVGRVLLFGLTPTFLESMGIPHINISEDSIAQGVAGFTFGQLQHSIAAVKDISFDHPSTRTISNCIISHIPSYCLSPGCSPIYPRQYIFQSLPIVCRGTVSGAMVKMVTKSDVPGVNDLTLSTVRALLSRAESVLGADFRVANVDKLPFSGDVWANSTLKADQDDPESPLYKLSAIPSKGAIHRILHKYGFLTHASNEDASQFDKVTVVSAWLDDHIELNKDPSELKTGPLLRLPKKPFNNTSGWIADHLTERLLNKTRSFDTNFSQGFNEGTLQTLLADAISHGIVHGAGGGVSQSIFLEGTLKEDPNEIGGYRRADILIIAAVLSLIELKLIRLVRLYEGTFNRTITESDGQLMPGQYTELRRFYKYLISIPKTTWNRGPLRRVPTLQDRKLNGANMDFIDQHRDMRPQTLEDFYYRRHYDKVSGAPYDQSVITVFHDAEKQVKEYGRLLTLGRVFDNRLLAVTVEKPVRLDIYTTVCLGGCCVVAQKLGCEMSKYTVKEKGSV